jgi:hypothetical protein
VGFVSRQKVGKGKTQPLRKDRKKEFDRFMTVVGENTNNGDKYVYSIIQNSKFQISLPFRMLQDAQATEMP